MKLSPFTKKVTLVRIFTILTGCFILVFFIGFLIFFNYQNQLALQASSLEGFRLDLEKRAASLDYFFSERKYDLISLVNSREVSSYFTNKNLGMSEHYGLKVSLFVIDDLFKKNIEKKSIHGDAIYKRIMLLDRFGVPLVDNGIDLHQKQPVLQINKYLTPNNSEPSLFLDETNSQIIFAVPYFFQNKFAGEIISWLNLTTLYDHLIKFSHSSSGKCVILVTKNGYPVNLGLNSQVLFNKSGENCFCLEDMPANKFGPVGNLCKEGFSNEVLAIKIPLKNTPLFLVAWTPTSEIYGLFQPWQLLLATIFLGLFILMGIGVLFHFNIQNLLLKTRFDESSKQQYLLEDKNQQLENEIDLRYEAEKELLKKQELIEEQKKELQKSMDKTFSLAYYDTLTGLPNRQLCLDRIKQALNSAHRNKDRMALLFLDLDQFKHVNDTLGHANGDLLLKIVADRLKSCLRENDTVARLGGDEFILLVNSVTNQFEIIKVAEKILKCLDHHLELDGHEVFTTASIGIVIYPEDGQNSDTLLKHADMAMYAAKEKGRNNFQFFSQKMNREALDRREMEMYLRQALQNEELSLSYQPQWNISTGEIVGLEALLRWNHKEKGEVLPARFIPLAEETGLIIPIGKWVLQQVFEQVLLLQKLGIGPILMAINVSGSQTLQPSFLNYIDLLFEQTKLNPQYIEFELTESSIMEDAPQNIFFLQSLKKRGLQIAIDDFGTGYSSLSYLKNFPIDRIKIDKSFVKDIVHSENDAVIVQTIIAMAKSLSLQVIAEGVETREQKELLAENGCEIMQGYYFSWPIDAKELPGFLLEKKALNG